MKTAVATGTSVRVSVYGNRPIADIVIAKLSSLSGRFRRATHGRGKIAVLLLETRYAFFTDQNQLVIEFPISIGKSSNLQGS